MLKVIDLKSSNISSVIKALKHIGTNFEVVDDSCSLAGATKILLPGVGSYQNSSKKLLETGMADVIRNLVLSENVPILGICVGMQLLANCGDEGGRAEGLGLIEGHVKILEVSDKSIKIPHLGWNSFDDLRAEYKLFKGVPMDSCFYFAHSYEFNVYDKKAKIAFTHHGKIIPAYIEKNNIYGAQFHPEKSQFVGLRFLRNFVELC
jgi:glutamine amidotransferase